MCNTNSTTPPLTPTPSTTTTTTQTMKKKKKKKKSSTKTQKKQKQNSCSSNSSSSSSSSLKPVKTRNRTKTRKPKYLSLRLQLSQTKKTTPQQPQQQSIFSPLQTEADNTEENMALLFSSDGGATTLTGLLEDESTTTATAATSEDGLSAMTCPAMEGLVRKAMRRRRSDEGSDEERWVCYSEVVEERKEMMMMMTEEVNSASEASGVATTSFGSLSLKLDHEGILNAWSDKGSLYVAGDDEGPQIVPDLLNHSFLHPLPPNVGYGCDVGGNLWKVPEVCGGNGMSVKEEMGCKLGQREASVLRYKEKRQNRLFAKRIRYEVRKLNAEKRPRMKGRFVKRE